MEKQEGELLVSLADDGKGFDTALMQQSKGMGWENLRTRVGLLQGKLEVNSKPGKGTLVFVAVPIPVVAAVA